MTSIAAGFNAVKLAFNIAKDLKDATAAYTEAEFRLKISELYTNLADAKMSLSDAQLENHALQAEILKLKEKIKSSDDLVYKDGVYFRKEPLEDQPNGPFCPKCYQEDKSISSLDTVTGHFRSFGKYKCPKCGSRLRGTDQ
ncbi:TPA: hypothetical protein PXL76_004264 [Yersinia enterocolitica]|nr:hypothetical protein [Yersinia enterocolitica]EKN5984703.1 hypothetical protein [Yersinia enterocolitica]EKN5988819.1 hypothetical protein [Yersinia enterocolitica]ELX2242938.1 hypothetical protein [Yersinia enterocolitica]HDL6717090.1 hypothetical protein [Yersinia enterocolitica]